MITEPIFTSSLAGIGELEPYPGSLYIKGSSSEDRSQHSTEWEEIRCDVTFARVLADDVSEAIIEVGGKELVVRLRSADDIDALLGRGRYAAVYLDITGLEHHVWGPILKGMRISGRRAFCVYVEPGDYRFSVAPTEGTIFDLSDSILGIRPLPGFASLMDVADEDALFVPLLGFEGTRFAHIMDSVQPGRDRVFPVIGVPGFRPEYPFYTYWGNRVALMDTGAWQYVRFAQANCPFSLYHVLSEIAQRIPGRYLKIAPIGTKPHALGAFLYYLDHSATTEIVYDHPKRKVGRTVGVSRTFLYDLSLLPSVRAERSVEGQK